MSRFLQVVFVRSGCAFILSCVGSLIGLVAWAGWTAQHDYPRSPSSIVWAAVGGTFGFVLGACIGNRRLRGRPAWLVLGLVGGMLAGALIGLEWAHAEYGFARLTLLQFGLPAEFIDAPHGGFSAIAYETIGLQHGICLGLLGGATAGWFWKHPPRLSSISRIFPVLMSCFIALGAIAMHTGFRDLSRDAIENGRQSWEDSQNQARPGNARLDLGSSEKH
jgi:hypothetical protein